MMNFKDDSFVLQYLSPKVMRDFRMFVLQDDRAEKSFEVRAIHNDEGFREIRRTLSAQYNVAFHIPDIQVVNVDRWGSRTLTLQHNSTDGRALEQVPAERVVRLLSALWKYNVVLKSVDQTGDVKATYVS